MIFLKIDMLARSKVFLLILFFKAFFDNEVDKIAKK